MDELGSVPAQCFEAFGMNSIPAKNNARYAVAVIDEDAQMRELLVRMVSRTGVSAFDVHPEADPLTHNPQLIVLHSGLRSAGAIRVMEQLADQGYEGKVLLVSGSGPGELEQLRRMGAELNLHMLPPLVKPVESAALRQALLTACPH